MTNFQDLFEKKQSQPIKYNNKLLYWANQFPLKGCRKISIEIEKTKSPYPQGISVDISGSCTCNGVLFKKEKHIEILIWEYSAPKVTELSLSTKDTFVWIQNVWEFTDYTRKKIVQSGVNGAAMIVEEIPNGRRYRCNDGEPNDDFDDIVFTVTRTDD